MFYSYILKISNGTYYSGFSKNLKKRIKEHKEGKIYATRNYRPITLVFYAAFTLKKKAIEFEKYLKSSSGFAFRKKHLV